MRVSVGAGTYVVAVSGGVDSMVLLDLLVKQYKPRAESPELRVLSSGQGAKKVHSSQRRFVVAHFDHGIRPDSAEDRKLVQHAAKGYGLSFVHESGNLGPGTSEALARNARYKFLHTVMDASKARAIITAHHQDDLLETAVLNLLRGSGRRGLTSLKSTELLLRPLLGYTKDQLLDYAADHGLSWREDPTNDDTRLARNHVRHNILPKFSVGQRAQLIILLEGLVPINRELDISIANLLHVQPGLQKIDRQWFIKLPHSIAREVVRAWLRRQGIRNLTQKTVERLITAMKTAKPGSKIDVDRQRILTIHVNALALVPRSDHEK